MTSFTRKIFSAVLAMVVMLSFTGLVPIKAQAAEATGATTETSADPTVLNELMSATIPLGDGAVNMIATNIGDKLFKLNSGALGYEWSDLEFYFFDNALIAFDQDVILVRLDDNSERHLSGGEWMAEFEADSTATFNGFYLGVLDANRNPLSVICLSNDEYYSETYEFYSTSPDVDFGVGLNAESMVKLINTKDIALDDGIYYTREGDAIIQVVDKEHPANAAVYAEENDATAEPAETAPIEPTAAPAATEAARPPIVTGITWSEEVPGEFTFTFRDAIPEFADSAGMETVSGATLRKDGEDVAHFNGWGYIEVGIPGQLVMRTTLNIAEDFVDLDVFGWPHPEDAIPYRPATGNYTVVIDGVESPVYSYISPEDAAAGSDSLEPTPTEAPAPQTAPETTTASVPAQATSTRTYTWGALIQIINSPESVVVEEVDGWTIVDTPIGRLKVESKYVR